MKHRHLLSSFLVFALAACASAPAPPPVAPAPTPTTFREPPLNWHLLDATSDGWPGISVLRAERELLNGKQPKRVVTVAVIDNGIDTTHAALRAHLWMNEREIPGNDRDDDNNGYVDDVRGWNLIGGRDGRIVNQDTYELTRLAAACADTSGSGGSGGSNGSHRKVPAQYRAKCPEIQTEFAKKRSEIDRTLDNIRQIEAMYTIIVPILKHAAATDSLIPAKVQAIQTVSDTVRQAKQIYLQLAAAGITPEEVPSAKKAYEGQAQYGYNLSYDPRPIVGDDYPDTLVKRYGNTKVVGAGAEHGTHVAGIIGADRQAAGAGARSRAGQAEIGIAQSVRLIAVRAVPDGDERDKDIAFAIRYAVDNGAQVINMSFGKGYSPYKGQVDAAVKYADSKGVLMVHAAGNDGENSDTKPSFPSPNYLDGGRAQNWIEVGASSWRGKDSLVAGFSNYGHTAVDVFAPGEDIYSTAPNGTYKKESGTSMASPVVAGLAAMLMSYYPNLTSSDVRRIILESATRYTDQMVVRPGAAGDRVRFGDLSVTGGVVNAYNAVKLAEQLTATRP